MHLITLVNYYCTCWGFAIDQLVLEYLLHRCVTLIKQMWLHTYQFLFGFKAQNLKVMQLAELCGAVPVPRNAARRSLLRERRVPAMLRGKLEPEVGFCQCVSAIEWAQERNKQTSSGSASRFFSIVLFCIETMGCAWRTYRETNRRVKNHLRKGISWNWSLVK